MMLKFLTSVSSFSLLLATPVPLNSNNNFVCSNGNCAKARGGSHNFMGKIKTNGACGSGNIKTIWVNQGNMVQLSGHNVCWEVVGSKIKTRTCNANNANQQFDYVNNDIVLLGATNGKCVNSSGGKLRFNSHGCNAATPPPTTCTPSTLWPQCPGSCHDCKYVDMIDYCDMSDQQKAECTNMQMGTLNECFTWKCQANTVPDSTDFGDDLSGDKVFVCKNNGGNWSSDWTMMGEMTENMATESRAQCKPILACEQVVQSLDPAINVDIVSSIPLIVEGVAATRMATVMDGTYSFWFSRMNPTFDQTDVNQEKLNRWEGSIEFTVSGGQIVGDVGIARAELISSHKIYESSFTDQKITGVAVLSTFVKNNVIDDNCKLGNFGCEVINFKAMKSHINLTDIQGYTACV